MFSMMRRSNDGWISELQTEGQTQQLALQDLRDYLWRAVFIYLRDKRQDVNHLSIEDLQALADDFSQNALVLIQKNLHSFKGTSKFTTWAYRFVINEAAAELRRRHYRHVSLDALFEDGTAVLTHLATQKSLDPNMVTERKDILHQIALIIENDLNERQRLAVCSVHLLGHSIQETAEQLNTSPNTLYKILHDARKKLRASLEKKRLSIGDILAPFEES